MTYNLKVKKNFSTKNRSAGSKKLPALLKKY